MSENRPYPFIGAEELRKKHDEYQLDEQMAGMYGQAPTVPADPLTQWKRTARNQERHPQDGYRYPAIRREGQTPGRRPLETYHGESLISWLENEHLQNPEVVLNVLDVGAGAGLYAEQIRDKLGTAVKVYSTGLRKKAARLQREQLRTGASTDYSLPAGTEIKSDIANTDLKWRSILQLSDFEEFNLIVDTAGEFAYAVRDEESARRYILAVIHKLLPGGRASIGFISERQKKYLDLVFKDLKNSDQYKNFFTFELNQNSHPMIVSEEPEYILKIYKTGSIGVSDT